MGAVVIPSSPDLDPARRSAEAPDPAVLARQARRLSAWARVVLVPVAVIGAVLSYQSLYKAAQPTFGPYLAAGFPLLVDLLILGASLQYVAGAKVGRPMTGWRLTAHCGVAGTLFLNALASRNLGEVPWHVTAPAVWAVLVELTGKQVLGQWKAANFGPTAAIPPSLWISAPIESFRTRLLMARTGVADSHQARIGLGTTAAAREALNLALPRRTSARRDAKRVRRVVNRQMRAGSLPPQAVLGAVGWADPQQQSERSPEKILRSVVQEILRPAGPGEPAGESAVDVTVAVSDPVAVTEDRVIVLPDASPVSRHGERAAGSAGSQEVPLTVASISAAVDGAASNGSAGPAAVRSSVPGPSVPDAVNGFVGVSAVPQMQGDARADMSVAPVAPAPVVPVTRPVADEEGVTVAVRSAGSVTAPERVGEPVPTRSAPVAGGGSLWAAAQARTNGPDTAGIPVLSAAEESGVSSVGASAARGWEPTAPLPQGGVPGTVTDLRQRSSENATETGSILISGRPTAKQKEERLDIAVRILNRNPDITGGELRAELEKEGWVVSDRTAARILGEAKQIPPLRTMRY